MSDGGARTQRAALRRASLSYGVTEDEAEAIRRYQAHDGTHESLNTLLRGRSARPPEVRRLRTILRGLDSILQRAELPVAVTVFKGVTDIDLLLPPDDPLPTVLAQHAYLSTTLDRRVAVREFMGSEPRAALLQITAPAGVPGLWLPPIGDREYAYESEVLFRRGTLLAFLDRRVDRGILMASCEVVW